MKKTYITQPIEEWRKEATERFGDDPRKWAFKCPACGKESSTQEFIDCGAEGNSAVTNCIGRVNGLGKPPAGNNPDGCDWAAYGLLGNLGKGRTVIMENGKSVDVFDFADVREKVGGHEQATER